MKGFLRAFGAIYLLPCSFPNSLNSSLNHGVLLNTFAFSSLALSLPMVSVLVPSFHLHLYISATSKALHVVSGSVLTKSSSSLGSQKICHRKAKEVCVHHQSHLLCFKGLWNDDCCWLQVILLMKFLYH